MKILFLEPFFGGSHKDFALGFAAHTRHEVDLVTLPARFWKWRMRGAALEFIRQIDDIAAYDLVFATDMMDITDFKALAGSVLPPLVLYFHENQLSYPLGPGEKRDFHLGFTNIVSALAADRVVFNSHFHLDAFISEARKLIRQMPDFRPAGMMDGILEKARVVYPGCRVPGGPWADEPRPVDPPLVVWNHRWEYDKNPEAFFRALGRIKRKNIPFSLAVLGEQYDACPDVFKTAREEFRDEIRVWGYVDSREDYTSWLARGSLVVSCAIQENFGISVMEAVRYGCFPLLPHRLSYPEIFSCNHHGEILYRTEDELVRKLETHLCFPGKFISLQRELSRHAAGYSWEFLVNRYDNMLENMIIFS